MKKLATATLLAAMLLSLFACSKKDAYSDSVPCSDILDKAEEQIPVNLGYESFDGEHIKYYFKDTELDDDHALRYSVLSDDINEIGIFHAPDKSSRDALYELTEEYLDTLYEDKKAFIESYAPKEIPKLEGAEVRVLGNYVAYAILSENDRELFFDTVEAILEK